MKQNIDWIGKKRIFLVNKKFEKTKLILNNKLNNSPKNDLHLSPLFLNKISSYKNSLNLNHKTYDEIVK